MTPRQKEIVEKAIEIIVEDGFKALTVKNLSEKMGFSEPALYRHFKGKNAVILAILEKIKTDMEQMISDIDTSKPARSFFLDLMGKSTLVMETSVPGTMMVVLHFLYS